MRVLITGGADFIVRHISNYLAEREGVRIIDKSRSGSKSNLSRLKRQLILNSILDRDLVREAMIGVHFVFHFAAVVSVQESMQKPKECAEINIRGTTVLLEDVARARAKKVIFSSSAAICGDNAVPQSVASIEKMHAAGFGPVCDLARGLGATIEFFSKDIVGVEWGGHL